MFENYYKYGKNLYLVTYTYLYQTLDNCVSINILENGIERESDFITVFGYFHILLLSIKIGPLPLFQFKAK